MNRLVRTILDVMDEERWKDTPRGAISRDLKRSKLFADWLFIPECSLSLTRNGDPIMSFITMSTPLVVLRHMDGAVFKPPHLSFWMSKDRMGDAMENMILRGECSLFPLASSEVSTGPSPGFLSNPSPWSPQHASDLVP